MHLLFKSTFCKDRDWVSRRHIGSTSDQSRLGMVVTRKFWVQSSCTHGQINFLGKLKYKLNPCLSQQLSTNHSILYQCIFGILILWRLVDVADVSAVNLWLNGCSGCWSSMLHTLHSYCLPSRIILSKHPGLFFTSAGSHWLVDVLMLFKHGTAVRLVKWSTMVLPTRADSGAGLIYSGNRRFTSDFSFS